MDWGYVLGIVGAVAAILFAYLAFRRGDQQDTREAAQKQGAILTELGYIKSGVDDIKAEQREQRKINTEVSNRLAAVEIKADRAHSRLDRLERHEDK